MAVSLPKKIAQAMKDDWVKGKEAFGVVVSAQRNGVKPSEIKAVKAWAADLEGGGVRIAAGTRALIDRFISRHDGKLDLESAPLPALQTVFDQIDFWHHKREIGASFASYGKLPQAVRKGYEQVMADDGYELDEAKKYSDYFSFELRGSRVYGAHYEDGSGFSIKLFSPRGRQLYDFSGQID
jgi:hypothetical protein